MDTNEPIDEYTVEIAKVLKHQQVIELDITFDELEARSGIPVGSLKRYINGQRPIKMGQFFKLCAALSLDPADVVAQVESKLSVKLENSNL